ncbi:hypothetical protein [Micromonospora sp. WMMD812]|uniref:hypothetical protein n=1 Tax=Micromonospora sp. WMMD812 TaxID=3015152 RepID=UPI00248C6DE4|nr:hypothetical protein [Micromonospora sp. WMMD812]WBB65473.1 hypothetical protein O7603_19960 [Micromonospora sp. WMMD812]
MTRHPRRRSRLVARRGITLTVLAVVLGALATVQPVPTRLPVEAARAEAAATGSAFTVKGRNLGPDDVIPGTVPADYSKLEITVSQTTDLVNQAVVVTWKDATPTPRDRLLGVDYLQVMQCWGDPHAVDDPLGLKFRETCQFGAKLDAPDMPNRNNGDAEGVSANSRELTNGNSAGYPERDPGETLPADAQMVPFWPVTCQPVSAACEQPRTPDGSSTNPFPIIKDPKSGQDRQAFPEEVLARYFSSAVTNEYPYALTAGDGTGRVAFEVQNSLRAPDLGCGASYQDAAGEKPSRPCWLVVVPRGHTNPYTGADVSATGAVHGSPLTPALWQHRIVVPLEFEPVGDACPLGRAERLTSGTELAAEAARSWRPALCTAAGGPSVSYSAVGDFDAARQLLSPFATAPGLIYSAEPVSTTAGGPRIVHAPVALSGVVIALNIDVNLDKLNPVDPETEKLRGLGLSDLKLTPRLVAKLLTQSYRRDVPGNGGPTTNPGSIRDDPEFLDLNPVFRSWDDRPSFTLQGLMAPNGSSVAARALWQWVLADPAAAAWVKGTAQQPAPDQDGMRVNPSYAELLSGGAPDYFPKVDQTCVPETYKDKDGNDAEARLCTLDYRPYTGGLGKGAEQTLRSDTTGRSAPLDLFNIPITGIPEFSRIPRDQLGARFAMSVTDSASAARYGLYTAKLCKATYRQADRRYEATDCREADEAGMLAAARSAAPAQVQVIDPAKAWSAPGAYPLSLLTYAVADTTDPADARQDYAALVRYAVGAGQQPGAARGQLPEGYVPLPENLRIQARAAADALEQAVPPTTPTSTTDNPPAFDPPPAAGAPAPPAAVPTPGAVPSPAGTAPSPQPSTNNAARASQGSPLGNVRYLLVGVLVLGLVGGVAGPILRRYGTRYLPTDSVE